MAPAPSTPASRLFALPAELRNRIYELVLCEITTVLLGEGWAEVERSLRCWRRPALLSTCRQTASEASLVYYSENVFMFNNECDGLEWLELIEPASRTAITRLCHNYDYANGYRDAVTRLTRFLKRASSRGMHLREDTLFVEIDDDYVEVVPPGEGWMNIPMAAAALMAQSDRQTKSI